MEWDPEQLEARDVYRLMVRMITPRPIAWVTTLFENGAANLAPFSYFNAVGSRPATIMFCPGNRRDGRPKHTLSNIQRSGEFVVNIVSFAAAQAMVQTSLEMEDDVSELETVGLTPVASLRVAPPRVAESPAHLECHLHQIVQLAAGPGAANLVIGRIVQMHVADEVLDADGSIDPGRLDTIGRLGGFGYCRTTERFQLRPE